MRNWGFPEYTVVMVYGGLALALVACFGLGWFANWLFSRLHGGG